RQGDFVADHYVVATGSFSTPLMKFMRIRLPMRPAKGYSLTLERSDSQAPLRTPVVDDHLHAVITPLGDQLRVAGTAEFSGYDLTLPQPRIENLVNLVRMILPHQRIDPTKVRSWCGLRAITTDGVPIVGRTPLTNLYVNTGHGHLGWTMAAGSAQLLVDLITGKTPAINQESFALARFY
ncbi:MAG TPA: FAD-dependent oxidoreductase, partial [Steroidobacteraceae bacterium]